MFLQTIIHSRSKTLAGYLAMFCFGIALGSWVPVFETSVGILLVLGVFSGGCLVQRREQRFIFFAIAFLFLGIFRLHQAVLPSHVITVADRTGVTVRVEGDIDTEVEKRMSYQRVVLDDVLIADVPVDGKVLVHLPLHPNVFYRDHLVFSCKLENPEPFEGFAYDRFLAVRGIYAVCAFPQYVDIRSYEGWSFIGSVLSVKQKLVHTLERILPEPHAGFMTGLLFGGSSSLSPELKSDFATTGTSHILAASGFNVSLFSLVFLGWILQTRVGRKRGLILTFLLVILYTITAGATPAVIRAALMGSVVLVQHWISRRALMMNMLLLVATLMLFVNPLLLFDDVGFQLSFAATIGIVIFTESIEKHLGFIPARLGVRKSFAGSLAAILITTPILLWQFGQISLVAPFANLLILPLVPFALVVTILALVVGIFSVQVGIVMAVPVWALSSVMLWIIRMLGSVDFALLEPLHSEIITGISLGVCVLVGSKLILHDKTY
jgi:competence protein ComEC